MSAPEPSAGAPSIAGQLAAHTCALRGRGAGARERAAAQVLIEDWLGCAVAGLVTPVGRLFLAHAGDAGQGPCTALGHGALPAEAAALHNGALSHIVEMDDVERASVLHPGTVVIPAALAAAERAGTQGPALLDAVVAGYEVMVRIGAAVGTRHYEYFHNTATCGPFGAAAAAGLALGLDAQRLTWALGNAGTLAAGLWQFNLDGALTKPLHAGRAAATGVLAAQLAARGLSGAEHILEGPRGFFAALAPQGERARVLAGLGETPAAVHAVSLKPYASCRHTHAPIDAALALRAALGAQAAAQAPRVVVRTYATALAVCDRADPHDPAQAKFSLQFCVASALVRGDAGLGAFEGPALQDRAVRALARRVVLEEDPRRSAAYPREWSAEVAVETAPQQWVSREQRSPRGDPESPLDPAARAAKLEALLAYAGRSDHADALRAWVQGLGGDAPLRTQALRGL